jgi:hypothetical protein
LRVKSYGFFALDEGECADVFVEFGHRDIKGADAPLVEVLASPAASCPNFSEGGCAAGEESWVDGQVRCGRSTFASTGTSPVGGGCCVAVDV